MCGEKGQRPHTLSACVGVMAENPHAQYMSGEGGHRPHTLGARVGSGADTPHVQCVCGESRDPKRSVHVWGEGAQHPHAPCTHGLLRASVSPLHPPPEQPWWCWHPWGAASPPPCVGKWPRPPLSPLFVVPPPLTRLIPRRCLHSKVLPHRIPGRRGRRGGGAPNAGTTWVGGTHGGAHGRGCKWHVALRGCTHRGECTLGCWFVAAHACVGCCTCVHIARCKWVCAVTCRCTHVVVQMRVHSCRLTRAATRVCRATRHRARASPCRCTRAVVQTHVHGRVIVHARPRVGAHVQWCKHTCMAVSLCTRILVLVQECSGVNACAQPCVHVCTFASAHM